MTREVLPRHGEIQSLSDMDIAGTSEHIVRGGFKRVALQFPDEELGVAEAVLHALQAALTRLEALAAVEEPAELFVLADTSFDGFQLDFVAAQHVNADLIVHYGDADLEAEGPIASRFVFGRRPISAASLAASVRKHFDSSRRVLIVPSLPYSHACEELLALLAPTHGRVVVAFADVAQPGAADAPLPAPPPAAAADPSAEVLQLVQAAASGDGGSRLLGRRLSEPLEQSDLSSDSIALVYVGAHDRLLSSLCVLLPRAEVYTYEPPVDLKDADEAADATELSRLQLQTARELMRRYYLVQQAREAEIVGILVGTLSAAGRKAMLAALKQLCRRTGRKHYVFVMGKLNEAKLANFLEVGVYVLLGSAQHSLLDNKKFYRPVVTPYELFLALSPGSAWTGDYVLDYARLLPMLATPADAHVDSDGEQAPEFSLLSGKLLRSTAHTVPSGSADGALQVAAGGQLAKTGQYALAQTGAEFLARRTYSGLEPRYGEHAPALVQQGLTGIASSFAGEGGGMPEEKVHPVSLRAPKVTIAHAAPPTVILSVRALSGDSIALHARVA